MEPKIIVFDNLKIYQDIDKYYQKASHRDLRPKMVFIPPCSVGETLTTFDPDIGKHFAAFLSKIMTPSWAGENKPDLRRSKHLRMRKGK